MKNTPERIKQTFDLPEWIIKTYPQLSQVKDKREADYICDICTNNRTVSRWLSEIEHAGYINLRRESIPYHLNLIESCIRELSVDRHYPYREVIRTEGNKLASSRAKWKRFGNRAHFVDDPDF